MPFNMAFLNVLLELMFRNSGVKLQTSLSVVGKTIHLPLLTAACQINLF